MTVHVLIPYRPRSRGGSDVRARNADVVWSWWHRHYGARPVVGDDPNPSSFNRGRAINVAALRAQPRPGDVLVLADADLIPHGPALEEAVGAIALGGHRGMIVPFTEVRYLSEPEAAAVHDAGGAMRADPDLDGVWDWLSTGGINVLSADLFDEVGGFDPRFEGWGFEDAAFDIACAALGEPTRWVTAPVWHLWHPPSRDPAAPTYETSLALCRRYEAAAGSVAAVRALIEERPR